MLVRDEQEISPGMPELETPAPLADNNGANAPLADGVPAANGAAALTQAEQVDRIVALAEAARAKSALRRDFRD